MDNSELTAKLAEFSKACDEAKQKAHLSTSNNPPEDDYFSNCRLHGIFDKRNKLSPLGREYTQWCPHCDDEAWLKKLLEIRDNACIPKRFESADFDSYIAKTNEQQQVLEACRNFATAVREGSDGSLVLLGNVGTGKTHLGIAIASDVLQAGITAEYITVREMIRWVRSTWKPDSELSESEAINHLASRKLLIVDEVGVQNGSPNEMSILFDIFDGRYQNRRPTVVISNLESDNFKLALGERIVDRLRDHGRMLQFFWESHRKQESVALET